MKTVAIIGCGSIANMAHLPALSIDDESGKTGKEIEL